MRFVKEWPSKEIIGLYQTGGWWRESDGASVADRIVSGSFAFAVAVDEKTGRAVGMGRALSDGVSDAYIQDVIVLPSRRSRNVGSKLIAALRDYCLCRGIGWVGLVAEPGTGGFYRKLGFRSMRGHTPMKYEVDFADD